MENSITLQPVTYCMLQVIYHHPLHGFCLSPLSLSINKSLEACILHISQTLPFPLSVAQQIRVKEGASLYLHASKQYMWVFWVFVCVLVIMRYKQIEDSLIKTLLHNTVGGQNLHTIFFEKKKNI